jgi:hypothetical protein
VRAQGYEKPHERSRFCWRERGAVRRHVSPALQYLADHLIFGQAGRHEIKRGAALSTESTDCMTISTLFLLEDNCALSLKRSASVEKFDWNNSSTPCVHLRAPWGIGSKLREHSPADSDECN